MQTGNVDNIVEKREDMGAKKHQANKRHAVQRFPYSKLAEFVVNLARFF